MLMDFYKDFTGDKNEFPISIESSKWQYGVLKLLVAVCYRFDKQQKLTLFVKNRLARFVGYVSWNLYGAKTILATASLVSLAMRNQWNLASLQVLICWICELKPVEFGHIRSQNNPSDWLTMRNQWNLASLQFLICPTAGSVLAL